LHPQFISGAKGNLFVLHRDVDAPSPAGTIIIVPPFGEEMNRTRILMNDAAERLAHAGYSTIIFDLSGTGDSAGDLSDTRWNDWINDLTTVVDWVDPQQGQAISFLGIRLGGLLAAQFASKHPHYKLALWNPVVEGKDYIDHLRRITHTTTHGNRDKTDNPPPQRPGDARGLDVLGYTLNQGLIEDISNLHLGDDNDGTTLRLDPQSPPYWALEIPVPMTALIDETIQFFRG
jgi:exosortase A-associated hydrolase 2